MNARLIFDFTIGHYNGTMSMRAVSGDRVLFDKKNFDTDKFSFETEISWPDPVHFFLSNKNPNDTLVDESGTIVQDKFIKLESITVDRLPVHIVALLECVEIDTGVDIIKTNYWGFNGVSRILFDRDDTLSWHLNNMTKVSDQDPVRKSVVTQHKGDAGMGPIY